MNKKTINQLLHETIAEFIDNDYPLYMLTGSDPDGFHKDRLEEAMRATGHEEAANKLKNMKPAE